jgi:uncharacterized membrane protein HdeD (DUF308 family)
MNKLLAPLFELRTHQHTVYFLVQLFIGIVYFTVLMTGLSATAGLAMSVIGLPFAAVTGVSTLYVAKKLWNGERWLLNRLYQEDFFRFGGTGGEGLLGWMKESFSDKESWIAFVSGLIRLPLGVFVFTVLVVSQVTFLALLAAPFYYDQGLVQFGGEAVLTSPVHAVIAVVIGLLGLFLSSHVIRFAGDRLIKALRAN